MNLRERAGLIATVSSALSRGEHTLTVLPSLIRQLLEEGAWREFETKLGKHVTYDRFEDFVVTPPLAGLGANVELLRRIVGNDPVTLDLLDQTLQREPGRPEKILYNVQDIQVAPTGNTSSSALRRLRKDRPDLHARVLAGELSPHKAMQEAGFRPRTATINLDSPKSAESLVAKASPAFLDELRRLLL